MRMDCAWCKKVMAEAHPGEGEEQISHGICPICLRKLLATLNANAKEDHSVDLGGEG